MGTRTYADYFLACTGQKTTDPNQYPTAVNLLKGIINRDENSSKFGSPENSPFWSLAT